MSCTQLQIIANVVFFPLFLKLVVTQSLCTRNKPAAPSKHRRLLTGRYKEQKTLSFKIWKGNYGAKTTYSIMATKYENITCIRELGNQ